ncbi:MAG TPA: 2-oxoglutarate dehydrogenase complex dihydrolipoyllysine-residue succinyltransferase, partial [Gemmatimonadaceae bacterium]|nr:2-oxoglutarate dehydrogenase complex dihydrolipoyllysine-residue succinyltransferase [Gemmatimonadaceae bacterium]
AGTLVKRLKAEGDVVHVDELLGQMNEGAAGAAPAASAPAAAAPAPAKPAPAPAAPASPAAQPQRVAPSAQRMADEQGLSLAGVQGTGRGGVVSKPDVIEQSVERKAPNAAVPSSPPALQPSSPRSPGARETREKMSTRRKRIAENLLQSQLSTAHLTTFNEIDMSAVIAIREKHKERIEKEHGVKLSFMPFFAKAAVQALKAFPVVNAQIDGDAIIYKHYVNLGIAVASDAGLVVPNIKDAQDKSLLDLGREIVVLAKKARDIKLTMDDLTGGTFTITNGGTFGSLVSTPIINYPQVGIIGLHKIQDRAMVVNGQVVVRPMMYVALSYDHRIIDGQQAVLFLVKVKELMEDPAVMLLE